MVERMFRPLVTLGGGLLMQACCSILPPPPIADVGLMLHPQETNNWCWAATTQMITTHLGHGVTQCDLANQRFGRNDCCTAGCPKNAACNMPGWTMFTEAGFTTQVTSTPLPWSRVTRELACSKRPMSYAYGPQSGGVGHVVVVSGYRDLGITKYLAISDPWAPCQGTFRFLSFDEYSNSGTTNHWATNYEIRFGP